jgi:Flp pilus assembly CpaE family ATPase
MSALAAVDPHPEARPGDDAPRHGRLVAIAGAHGGCGVTRAAIAVARDATGGAVLIDADLGGGDAQTVIGLPVRAGDAGLAALPEVDRHAIADAARRTPFGWLYEACPRPDLAWLIRDGHMRELARVAMRLAPLVVVDAGRPAGPSLEPVADADVVVLLAHAHRADALARARRRLVRGGTDERRILECATAPTRIDRMVGRVRGDAAIVDVERDDTLMLMIEGRLAVLGPRDRA